MNDITRGARMAAVMAEKRRERETQERYKRVVHVEVYPRANAIRFR
jgi:hypothetical protein